MTQILRLGDAATIKLGPFVDMTDGVTYEVGLAGAMNHASTGVLISKNGGTLAARTTLTLPVYDAFGYYLVNLDATDTATAGTLKVIYGDAATTLPCEANFQIVTAAIYDAMYGASAAPVTAANVESECNDALVALNLDHLMKTAVANNADMTVEVPDGTVLSNLISATSDTSTYAVATDSLEAQGTIANSVNIANGAVEADLTYVHGDALGGTKPHDTP